MTDVETEVLSRIPVDLSRATVYEHGWQSWSPTVAYRLDERPFRPVSEQRRVGNYHPDRTAPHDAFWGEGLLAVDPGTGDGVHVFGARSADGPIPSVRAQVDGDEVVVSGSPDVDALVIPAAAEEGASYVALDLALAEWGDRFAAASGVGPLRRPPTAWCSWYHYFEHVTQDDIEENLAAIGDLDLDVEVVQIDDGYQAEIGDWLVLSDRFASLGDIVDRIRGAGRRAGIWVAPFLVGERSATRPGTPRLAGPGRPRRTTAGAASSSGPSTRPTRGRRPTCARCSAPSAISASTTSRSTSSTRGRWRAARADAGISGTEAYRHGLRTIREAIGPDSYLLGCGAPILPSVGLVDAMRVGPDIGHHFEPARRRPLPALAAGRGPEQPLAGLAAGPVLDQRRRLPGGRHARGAPGGLGRGRRARTAGCGPAATGSADSTSGGWRPPAGCCAPVLTAPFVP